MDEMYLLNRKVARDHCRADFTEKGTSAKIRNPFRYSDGAEEETRTPTGFSTMVNKDEEFVSRRRKEYYVELPKIVDGRLHTEE
jgi:hypothetical protein